MAWSCILLLLAAAPAPARPHAPLPVTRAVVIHAPGFARLPGRQQKFVYWLVQSAIAVDPIAYVQNGRQGREEKLLLEGIARRRWMLPTRRRRRFMAYLRRFWADHGNHDPQTGRALPLPFGLRRLAADAELARRAGAWHGSRPAMLALLRQAGGPLTAPRSRAAAAAGPADPYAYGPERNHVLSALAHARSYAAPGWERTQVNALAHYWRSGGAAEWSGFTRGWAGSDSPVVFADGFFGAHSRAAGFVCIGASRISARQIRCTAVVATGALAGAAAAARLGALRIQFANVQAARGRVAAPQNAAAVLVSPRLVLQRETVHMQPAGGLAAQRLRWALTDETYLPEPRQR